MQIVCRTRVEQRDIAIHNSIHVYTKYTGKLHSRQLIRQHICLKNIPFLKASVLKKIEF